MNKNYLLPLGVLAFAVMLAAVLRDSLSGAAALIAVGIAIGLIVGVPVGMLSMGLAGRAGRLAQTQAPEPRGLVLTPEQTELLLKAIERQQTSPAGFGLTSRETRSFTSVGGADVSELANHPNDQG